MSSWVDEDALWFEGEQRRHNLASFGRQQLVKAPRRKRHVFSVDELLVADRVAALEAERKVAA